MTHQRGVIHRIMAGAARHPTPEETFQQVRKEIPTISLATIQKNIKTFLDAGLLRGVSTSNPGLSKLRFDGSGVTGGADEEKMCGMVRKGRAFPRGKGRSPIKYPVRSTIWTALGHTRRAGRTFSGLMASSS